MTTRRQQVRFAVLEDLSDEDLDTIAPEIVVDEQLSRVGDYWDDYDDALVPDGCDDTAWEDHYWNNRFRRDMELALSED